MVADEHGGEEGNERLVGLVARHGVACADAPVLGTKQPAEHCQLVALASESEGVRERCEPVFGAVGSKTVWLAEAGEGSRLKLVLNNWIVGPPGCSQRPSRSPGRWGWTTEVPGHYRGRTAQVTLRAGKGENDGRGGLPDEPLRGLPRKDAGLVLEAAEAHDLRMKCTETVAARFDEAIEAGHGEEDMAAVYEAARPDRGWRGGASKGI